MRRSQAGGGKLLNKERLWIQSEEPKRLIEEHGGVVASGVSSRVHYVVVGEEAGAKLEKARTLNIALLTEQQLLDMVR